MFGKRVNQIAVAATAASMLLSGLVGAHAQTAPLEIKFYYPTAVDGPIAKIMAGFADDFNANNADIHVTPVYAGGYADIYKAIDTQVKGGGAGPDVAILLTTDMYSLIVSSASSRPLLMRNRYWVLAVSLMTTVGKRAASW